MAFNFNQKISPSFYNGVARLNKEATPKFDLGALPTSTQRVYHVAYDAPQIAPRVDVLNPSDARYNIKGVPLPGTAHELYPGLFVRNYDCEQLSQGENPNNKLWKITVTYERKDPIEIVKGGTAPDTIIGTRTLLEKSWGLETMEVPIQFDAYTGKPVLNSAGDTFLTVPTVSIPIAKLIFRRVETIHPAMVAKYNMTINSGTDTFMGYPVKPHCGLLRITCQADMDSENPSYIYTYEVLIKTNRCFVNGYYQEMVDIGWDEAAIEQGLYFIDPVDGKKKRCREYVEIENPDDPETPETVLQKSAAAVLLNQTGNYLNPPSIDQTTPLNAPIATRVQMYPKQDWGWLNLPQS